MSSEKMSQRIVELETALAAERIRWEHLKSWLIDWGGTPISVRQYMLRLEKQATTSTNRRIVTFTQLEDEGPWDVAVDGVVVVGGIDSDQLDVGDNAFEPLWQALGVKIEFIEEGDQDDE